MFTGHLSVALAAKSTRLRVPLWVLAIAAFGSDLVEIALQAARIGDPGQMRSHSIPAVLVIASLCALVVHAVWRDVAGALATAGLALSHVLLDYLTGTKPSWPGGPQIGMRLYAHPTRDLALELGFLILGGYAYWRCRGYGGGFIRRFSYLAALCLIALMQILWRQWLRSA